MGLLGTQKIGNGNVRPFKLTDLLWLERIAKEQGEWPELLRGLEGAILAVVEEPYAVAALYLDSHGVGLAALAGKEGIKQMIRIADHLKEQMVAKHVPIHGHWTPGTWQEKVAVRRGFLMGENGYHVIGG